MNLSVLEDVAMGKYDIFLFWVLVLRFYKKSLEENEIE